MVRWYVCLCVCLEVLTKVPTFRSGLTIDDHGLHLHVVRMTEPPAIGLPTHWKKRNTPMNSCSDFAPFVEILRQT